MVKQSNQQNISQNISEILPKESNENQKYLQQMKNQKYLLQQMKKN